MAAKQNLRRENPILVPWPDAYLWVRSSALFRIINYFVRLSNLSSFLAEND
jgi:hypothetical protein